MNTIQAVKSFVESLPSIVAKDDVMDEIENITTSIKSLKTAHAAYSKFYTKNGLHSEIAKELEHRILLVTKVKSINDIVMLGIRRIDKRIEELTSAAEKHLDEDNPKTVMSYDKAGILKLTELLSFWVKYSMSIMRYVCANEIALVRDEEPGYSKNFARKIDDGFSNWLKIYTLIVDAESLDKAIDKTTSVVDVLDDHSGNQLDKSKDPLQMGFIGTYFNIAYFITDKIGELRVWYYDYLKCQVNDILINTEYLESVYNDTNDENLARQIEKNQDKIKKIELKIKKIEEDAGV